MAITTTNPDGVRITTAAKNGTLSTQGAIGNNQIKFDTNISTNNGNLVTSPTFVGRLVILREGAGDEETRYITAIGTDGVTATVHEDWTANPASGDTYHVSYTIQDAATVTGLSLINKRTDDYSSTRKFRVGNTGGTPAFAYFAILDGASLESVDNSSTTVADIVVENNGRFDIGYEASGQAVSGGALYGTPAVAGEFVLDAVAGSMVYWKDLYMKCVVSNKQEFKGTATFDRVKLFKGVYTMDLSGVITMTDSVIEGINDTNDTVKVDATTDIVSMTLVNTEGFTTADDSTTETITIKNTNFVGSGLMIECHNDKTFRVINPTWVIDAGTQDQISFPVNDANSVEERFTFETTVTTPSGTAINGAKVMLYESSNDNLQHVGSTDANGDYSVDVIKRIFTYGTATTLSVDTRTNFALRIFEWDKVPFIGAIDPTAPINQPVSLSPDAHIVAASAAAAITAGSGITVTRDATNGYTLLYFDTGSGAPTLAVGDTVTGDTSTAAGTVIEFTEGDATSGKMLLDRTNTNAFQQNEGLTRTGGGWTGGVLDNATFKREFTWWIDADGKTMQVLYDYLMARLEETTLQSWAELAHEWGREVESHLLYWSGSGYYTESNDSEGIIISDRGAGAIDYFTDDADTQYTPPVNVGITITVKDADDASAIEYARVRVLAAAGGPLTEGTEIMNVRTNASGVASATVGYTSDQPVTATVRQGSYAPSYVPYSFTGTITSSGLTQTVEMQPD